ncbi:hypothetical protein NUBL8589_04450 [Klebsiella pneumoniae]|nr:hypothetical protein NUBL8589_04450 [Klebsiella pneumoniae]
MSFGVLLGVSLQFATDYVLQGQRIILCDFSLLSTNRQQLEEAAKILHVNRYIHVRSSL